MLKTKSEVSNLIINASKKILRNSEEQSRIITGLEEKYNMPISLSFDIITLKSSPLDENDFILFCLLDALDPGKITTCYTAKEIETYSNSKYKVEKIKFPIKWKMIQVSDDQWIGTISVKELIKLRDAQLINYNENAQRKLKRVVSGEEEWYSIDVNRDAVNAIVESYSNETYIPNTITLNMNETAEFHHDGENLVISELDTFDILDGYHRYIAMSNLYNLNRKFDYSMELRVVAFSNEKARQFIWQEDQKTKMNKIDSDSLNQNNPATQVVQMLSSKGILNGVISRNKGIIDYTSITQLVSLLFFNTRKKIDRKQIIHARDYIYERFDAAITEMPELFDKRWDNVWLGSFMFVLSNTNIANEDLLSVAKEFYNTVSNEEYKHIFTGRTFTTQTISRLSKVFNGGM